MKFVCPSICAHEVNQSFTYLVLVKGSQFVISSPFNLCVGVFECMCVSVSVYVCIRVFMCACVYLCASVWMYMGVRVYRVCMHVYMCACVCMCVFLSSLDTSTFGEILRFRSPCFQTSWRSSLGVASDISKWGSVYGIVLLDTGQRQKGNQVMREGGF